MIQPLNKHLKIKPIAQKSLFGNGKYEEMGEVLGLAEGIEGLEIGDKVFFDSWLAGKYPTGEQDENGEEIYFWLVRFDDVKAVEQKDVPK